MLVLSGAMIKAAVPREPEKVSLRSLNRAGGQVPPSNDSREN